MFFSCSSLRIAACSLILAISGSVASAQVQAEEGRDPQFITDSLYPVGVTQIRSIESFDSADVVILNAGHAGGLRQGMVVQVWRDGASKPVADLLIVSASRNRAAALITSLSPNIALQSGDIVQVKSQSF